VSLPPGMSRGIFLCLCLCLCVLQGYGVIGSTSEGPEEIEHAPALSLTLGSLPGTTLHISHITGQQLPDGGEWMTPAHGS